MFQDYQSGVETKISQMDQVLSRIDKAVHGEMYQHPTDRVEMDTVYLDEQYGSLDSLTMHELGVYIVDLQNKAEVRQGGYDLGQKKDCSHCRTTTGTRLTG